MWNSVEVERGPRLYGWGWSAAILNADPGNDEGDDDDGGKNSGERGEFGLGHWVNLLVSVDCRGSQGPQRGC